MILGRDRHPHAACFDEINDAIEDIDREHGRDRIVYLRGHACEVPLGGIAYNFENVPGQVANPRERWAGRTCWDFSARNAAQYDATHVPVGYHSSMTRFRRAWIQDIDVVFSGAMNERRQAVLDGLRSNGLRVVVAPPTGYGAPRDALLARAKLALNMLFYPDGLFPALRVAHLVANRVPVLSERCPEGWDFVPTCSYEDLVGSATTLVRDSYSGRAKLAEETLTEFKKRPMVLPS